MPTHQGGDASAWDTHDDVTVEFFPGLPLAKPRLGPNLREKARMSAIDQ
ncbi:MAG: hypothetical protein AB7Q42_21410 [Acidimicrobiia bacterium]